MLNVLHWCIYRFVLYMANYLHCPSQLSSAYAVFFYHFSKPFLCLPFLELSHIHLGFLLLHCTFCKHVSSPSISRELNFIDWWLLLFLSNQLFFFFLHVLCFICVATFLQIFEQVDFLHGVMSDKEYNVILNCTSMNLNEEPRLPPSFRGSKDGTGDTMRMLVDKVNMNSQILLSQTVNIMAVDINYALLELCNGIREAPLAHIAVSLIHPLTFIWYHKRAAQFCFCIHLFYLMLYDLYFCVLNPNCVHFSAGRSMGIVPDIFIVWNRSLFNYS